MERKRVVFCFHTHDHEINFGVGFLSSALKARGIDAGLVVYRETADSQDSPEDVVAAILEKDPLIVAFSVMTFNWHKIRDVIPLLRKDFGGMIVVGGYHAVLSPGEVIALPGVDAVCTGEGEGPIIELAEQAIGGRSTGPIRGVIFSGENRDGLAGKDRWLVERLDEYPYMDFGIFGDREALREKHLGVLSPGGIFALPVITGRGCPYRCTYCSNSALIDYYGGVKRFVRRYTPADAIRHFRGLNEVYKPQYFEFLDETFTLNKGWIKDFCKGYREQVSVPYIIMSRIDLLDEPTVAMLAESGLKLFFFGIESGDEEYRTKYLRRRMTDETIISGARLLKKYGIMIVTFNIFGMPLETKQTVGKTWEINERIEPDAALPFIYQPLPGTELANLAREHHINTIPKGDRWDFCSPSLDSAELPASYVTEITDRFRELFANQRIPPIYERLRKMANPLQ
ncbi:MAG TPA: radical SAM protein [Dissulfurispiraceae bacterium]|nr:radical SAM protein [Dissulfurispiraceae bacterium]